MASSMDATGALRVTVGGGSSNVTVLNPTLTVDDGGLALTVDDGGASITVDDGGVPLDVNVQNFPATQPISGTVAVSNFPSSSAGNTDANGRLRVSNAIVVQKLKFDYGVTGFLTDGSNTGTGVAPSYSVSLRTYAVRVNAGTGTSIFWSNNFVVFDSDSSYFCSAAFWLQVVSTGASSFIGWYDQCATRCQNGFTFEYTSNVAYFNLHYNQSAGAGTTVHVAQSSWNIDKADGTGASGVNIDFTQFQVVVFDVQQGTAGRIRCGFVVDGQVLWCHYFDRSVTTTTTWSTSSIPFYCATTASSSSAAQSIIFREASVIKESGPPLTPKAICAAHAGFTATGAAWSNGVSIRPKTTLNTVPNRRQLRPTQLSVRCTGQSCRIAFVFGATFSVAPTWGAADAAFSLYSGFETGTGGTITNFASGIVLLDLKNLVTDQSQIDLRPYFDLVFSPPCTLDNLGAVRNNGILTVAGLGDASTATISLSVTWEEYE